MSGDDKYTLPIFGDLTKINGSREEQARDKTILNLLLDTSERVLSDATHDLAGLAGTDFRQRLLSCSDRVYKQASQELNSVLLTETDLGMFILANSNSDKEINNRAALGIFTGALAQIITERNAKEGRRTRIYINGLGNRFDYLFLGAHNVDEIYVHNLRGDYIGANIQSASRLAGIGLYGNHIFNYCGDFRREAFKRGETKQINELVVIGIQCDDEYGNSGLLNNVNDLIAVGMSSINPTDNTYGGFYVDKLICVNVGKTRIFGLGICDKIILMGAELNENNLFNSGSLKKISKCMYSKEVPPPIGADLHRILYADSICHVKESAPTDEEYAQHKACLDADKLAAHLKDKSKDEIMRIVDEITRYTNELSERLLLK